jgi:sugar phosphate permease
MPATKGEGENGEEQAPYRGTLSQRLTQYSMLCSFVLALKILRASIPSFVPFTGPEFGFTDTEQAFLLSGFFQGYSVSQVPFSAIVQRFGAKMIMNVALVGTVGLFTTLPLCAKRFGAVALWGQLTLLGMIQGALAPGSAQFIRAWMPEGIEKVWALRTISLSHQSTDILGAFLTPRLCRHGLGYACRSLGTFCAAVAVVFAALARENPPPSPPSLPDDVDVAAASPPPAATDDKGKNTQKTTPKKAVEWRIFRVPACRAMVLYWLSCGNIYMNSAFCAFAVLSGGCFVTAPTSYWQRCVGPSTQWHSGHRPIFRSSFCLRLRRLDSI